MLHIFTHLDYCTLLMMQNSLLAQQDTYQVRILMYWLDYVYTNRDRSDLLLVEVSSKFQNWEPPGAMGNKRTCFFMNGNMGT